MNLIISRQKPTAMIDDRRIYFTPNEHKVILAIVAAYGEPVDRGDVNKNVYRNENWRSRSLDTILVSIRRKISPIKIITLYSVGHAIDMENLKIEIV